MSSELDRLNGMLKRQIEGGKQKADYGSERAKVEAAKAKKAAKKLAKKQRHAA